jgi:tetratricopeptide (TPR) repeat protein
MLVVALFASVLGAGIEGLRLKRNRDQFVARANENASLAVMYRDAEKTRRDRAEQYESLHAITLSTLDMPLQERPLLGRRHEEINKRIAEMREGLKAQSETEKLKAAEARSQAAKFAYYAEYHDVLKEKYLQASDRPWRSVLPDPPPPEPNQRAAYWERREDYHRAQAAYEEALRDEPENANPLNNLAWILSTCADASLRDGKRAVELATHACELTGRKNAWLLDTLAAAFAETGDFKAAVETQREALKLLGKQAAIEKEFRDRLESYEAKRPFRVKGKNGIPTSDRVPVSSLAPRENVLSRSAMRHRFGRYSFALCCRVPGAYRCG